MSEVTASTQYSERARWRTRGCVRTGAAGSRLKYRDTYVRIVHGNPESRKVQYPALLAIVAR